MPYMTAAQRASGGHTPPRPGAVRLPWDDAPPLRTPDQSRYGPPGSTDEPRYRADGVTLWPRQPKGDPTK